jgi:hypothetical protein
MIQKKAIELAVGDKIVVREGLVLTIEAIEPSSLSGFAAPVVSGTYNSGRKARIDLSSGRHLADHIFDIQE